MARRTAPVPRELGVPLFDERISISYRGGRSITEIALKMDIPEAMVARSLQRSGFAVRLRDDEESPNG